MKCVSDLQYRSEQQQLEVAENYVRVGPKYRGTDVTLAGCNTIENI